MLSSSTKRQVFNCTFKEIWKKFQKLFSPISFFSEYSVTYEMSYWSNKWNYGDAKCGEYIEANDIRFVLWCELSCTVTRENNNFLLYLPKHDSFQEIFSLLLKSPAVIAVVHIIKLMQVGLWFLFWSDSSRESKFPFFISFSFHLILNCEINDTVG